VEFNGANAIQRARYSRLISLFRSSEQEPFDQEITSNGTLLLESLLEHVRLTSPERLVAGGSFANYCVSVARFALFDQRTSLDETQVETVFTFVGEIAPDHRQHVADILRLTT